MPTGIYPRSVKPLRQRIAEGVLVDAVTGCWNWQRRRLPNGYGMLSVGQRSKGEKKNAYSHRVSYEAHVGPIPIGKELDHLCRNRCCCNPAHLEPVTRSENTLRGDGPAMLSRVNGSKTHCKKGHEFTPENTQLRPTGGRTCLACRRARPYQPRNK
jgi:hypothetical protein